MPPLKIIVAGSQIPLVETANDRLARALTDVLKHFGHRVSELRLPLPADGDDLPRHMATFRLFDLAHCDGEPGDLLIPLDLPAACLRHPRKVPWIGDLLGGCGGPSDAYPVDRFLHESVRRAARLFLAEAERCFATSTATAVRLREWTDFETRALLPPLAGDLRRIAPRDPLPEERPIVLLVPPEAGGLPVDRIRRVIAETGDVFRFLAVEEGSTALRELTSGDDLPLDLAEDGDDAPARASVVWLCGIDDASPWPTWRALGRGKPLVTTFDAGAAAELVRSFAFEHVVDPEVEAVVEVLGKATETGNTEIVESTEAFLRKAYPDWQGVVEKLSGESVPCA